MNKNNPTQRFFIAALLIASTCVALIVGSGGLNAATPSRLYLPSISVPASATSTPPPSATNTPTPEQPADNGGVFVTRDRETEGASSAVDALGGMHFVYTAYEPLKDNPQAYYSYCSAQPVGACKDPANWRTVTVGEQVNEVQLALTPDGKPRLMIRQSNVLSGSLSKTYYYAECDADCSNASQWQRVAVGTTTDTSAEDYDKPQRSFALDPQGRPRLFYYGGPWGSGSTYGAFYAACDLDCATNPPESPHWTTTEIVAPGGVVDYPVLTFTKAGQPRVLAVTYTGGGDLTYFACDADCNDALNWQRRALFPRGNGLAPVWDLALDGNDNPRLVHVQGELNGEKEQLLYAWCDTDCLSLPGAWQVLALGLGDDGTKVGYDASLALDGQGRPGIALHTRFTGGGLSYVWCAASCDTVNGQWQERAIEPNELLDQDRFVATPINCTPKYWIGGQRPDLALDANGNPRIASDAEWTYECLYEDPNDPGKPPTSRIEKYKYTRYTFLPHPR